MSNSTRITLKAIGILTVVFGLGLAFVIQDANLTYGEVARVYAASAADPDAYITSLFLCVTGMALACIRVRSQIR